VKTYRWVFNEEKKKEKYIFLKKKKKKKKKNKGGQFEKWNVSNSLRISC